MQGQKELLNIVKVIENCLWNVSTDCECYKLVLSFKTNLNMCILMYFKIQSDQLRITRNAFISQIFDLFSKSSSGNK